MNALRQFLFVVIAIAAPLALCRPCAAHPGYPASALVHINADGSFIMHVRHDCLAFALNETPKFIGDDPMRALLKNPTELRSAMIEARTRFKKLCVLSANGTRLDFEISDGPNANVILTMDSPTRPVRLPIMLEFVAEATLPAGTTHFSLQFPEVMGDVIMTVERPGAEPFSLPLRSGEQSPAIELNRIEPPEAGAPDNASTPKQDVNTEPPPAAPMGAPELAWRYVTLGVTHIIPRGLDHILFVLGLFFLSSKLKPLLWQVTTFTLAHSVTLTLATLGWIQLPPSVIEPIIAASITFIAVENMLTTRLHAWRPMIVFGFGLVHGMGFASVLKDAGLPHGQLALALVTFNVGVEIGQLSVIASAMLLLAFWRNKPWYRARIAIPASALIAAVGLWWTVQRIFGL